MSDFEFPNPESVSIGSKRLGIGLYHDDLSAEWDAEIGYADFISEVRKLDGIKDSTELYIEVDPDSVIGEPEMPETLGEARLQGVDGDPTYVTLFEGDYSVSWELKGSSGEATQSEIGVVLEPSETESVVELVERTTGEQASEDDYEALETVAGDAS